LGVRKAMIAVKCKIVPELKYHAMKMYEGVEVWLHTFVFSASDGDECQLLTVART
jgi:hypothetical protein